METATERMIRYLDNAWAVEKGLVDTLKTMAEDVNDPDIRQMFQEHAQVTWQQEEALEARIRALGSEPNGTKGWFSSMMGRMSDLMQVTQDDYDRTTQNVIKAYTSEQFEMAMYQALESYANAIGDTETAELARTHFEQERQTAESLWPIVSETAERPGRLMPMPGVRVA